MVVTSPTTNEWPQSSQVDEKTLMASANRQQGHQDLSQLQQQHQQQQQQQALRCPRCDSSNTKFCYYNNYSLSQPRHFCKACKRYWTRGGTLRNVPVGGGCRKNKRVKRPAGSMDGSNSSTPGGASPNPTSQPQIDISSSSNHISPLFYGLPGSAPEMNLPFSSRFNSGGYDLPPHLNALGLGFASNPLLSTYSGIFGSSSAATTASPSIASLLASTINKTTSYQSVGPFEDLQMGSNGGEMGLSAAMTKDVKVENGSQSRLGWNMNQMDQHVGFSDPTVYWNTTSSVGAWHDQGNIGSSVSSLI